jgi:hypothetical protein
MFAQCCSFISANSVTIWFPLVYVTCMLHCPLKLQNCGQKKRNKESLKSWNSQTSSYSVVLSISIFSTYARREKAKCWGERGDYFEISFFTYFCWLTSRETNQKESERKNRSITHDWLIFWVTMFWKQTIKHLWNWLREMVRNKNLPLVFLWACPISWLT